MGGSVNNFRLVLLDYAKHQLDKPIAQKTLNDLIIAKQKNFERTDPNYVVMDKHDMIGTHALIYETTNLFEPKLIFAIRLTYEDRAQLHKIKTPLQDLIPHLNNNCNLAYDNFKKHNPVMADCNSWFVDAEFSKKKSGLNLSDIGYTMVFLQLHRLGFKRMAGCTNEKYKAHRWLENIGSFEKGHEFIHPTVPDPHMLILVEKFKLDYVQSVYESNKFLFDNLFEITPQNETYQNIPETIKNVLGYPEEYSKAG